MLHDIAGIAVMTDRGDQAMRTAIGSIRARIDLIKIRGNLQRISSINKVQTASTHYNSVLAIVTSVVMYEGDTVVGDVVD